MKAKILSILLLISVSPQLKGQKVDSLNFDQDLYIIYCLGNSQLSDDGLVGKAFNTTESEGLNISEMIAFRTSFTLAFWLQADDLETPQEILALVNSELPNTSIPNVFSFGIDSGRFYTQFGRSPEVIYSPELQKNKWYFINLSWDALKLNLYIDNIKVYSIKDIHLFFMPPFHNANRLQLAASGAGSVKGKIDQLVVYPYSLAPTTRLDIFEYYSSKINVADTTDNPPVETNMTDSPAERKTKNPVNIIQAQDTLNFYTDEIILKLWDNDVCDGDVVSVYCNDKLVGKDIELSDKRKKRLKVKLKVGKNRIVFHGVDFGTYSNYNTASVEVCKKNESKVYELDFDPKANAVLIINNSNKVDPKFTNNKIEIIAPTEEFVYLFVKDYKKEDYDRINIFANNAQLDDIYLIQKGNKLKIPLLFNSKNELIIKCASTGGWSLIDRCTIQLSLQILNRDGRSLHKTLVDYQDKMKQNEELKLIIEHQPYADARFSSEDTMLNLDDYNAEAVEMHVWSNNTEDDIVEIMLNDNIIEKELNLSPKPVPLNTEFKPGKNILIIKSLDSGSSTINYNNELIHGTTVGIRLSKKGKLLHKNYFQVQMLEHQIGRLVLYFKER